MSESATKPTMGEIEALIDAYRDDFYNANALNDKAAAARVMDRRRVLRAAIQRLYDRASDAPPLSSAEQLFAEVVALDRQLTAIERGGAA